MATLPELVFLQATCIVDAERIILIPDYPDIHKHPYQQCCCYKYVNYHQGRKSYLRAHYHFNPALIAGDGTGLKMKISIGSITNRNRIQITRTGNSILNY